MIIHECEQGTEEWLNLRKAIPTASDAKKLVSNTGKLSSQIIGYGQLLAAELAGAKFDSYSSSAMDRGTRLEPEARAEYSLDHGPVEEVGFCTNDQKTFGYSPDGFFKKDGLIEIKCENISKFLGYIESDQCPIDHNAQIQSGLWITGRKWCDLVFYYPGLKLKVFRVLPDYSFFSKLEKQTIEVLEIRDEFFKKLTENK